MSSEGVTVPSQICPLANQAGVSPKQLSVTAGADENEFLRGQPVQQELVRPDVAVPMIHPLSTQRMSPAAGR